MTGRGAWEGSFFSHTPFDGKILYMEFYDETLFQSQDLWEIVETCYVIEEIKGNELRELKNEIFQSSTYYSRFKN